MGVTIEVRNKNYKEKAEKIINLWKIILISDIEEIVKGKLLILNLRYTHT